MAVLFKNNATAALGAAITSGATTSVTVATGAGSLFPSISGSDFYYVTLVDPSGNLEIVKVTARSGDTLTVVRAQDGTTALTTLTPASSCKVELRVTAAGLTNKLDKDGGTMTGLLTLGAGLTLTSTTALTFAAGTTNVNVGTVNFAVGLQKGGLPVLTTTDTQTLVNKTIDTAAPNTIKINGNTLDATAGTATITFPAATGTLVMRDTTETLTNKTLTSPTLNTIDRSSTIGTTGTASDTSIGYMGVPRNQTNGAYTLVATDNGKLVSANAQITIPAGSTWPIGMTVVIYNRSGGNINITTSTNTLYLAGTTTTSVPRVLATQGLATLVKVDTSTWLISGAGLS